MRSWSAWIGKPLTPGSGMPRWRSAAGRFIASNADRTLPTEQGLIPGAGSVVAFLEIATDVQPHVIGKPAPDIFLHALGAPGDAGQPDSRGGRPAETDIAPGQAAGLRTIGVLTGASPPRRLPQWIHRRIGCLRIWRRCGRRIWVERRRVARGATIYQFGDRFGSTRTTSTPHEEVPMGNEGLPRTRAFTAASRSQCAVRIHEVTLLPFPNRAGA